MNSLKNKTYIIAGASSGIGKNIAEYLTQKCSANVILIARRYEVIQSLTKKLPGNNYAIEFDFNNIEQIAEIFSKIQDWNIKVDGLVYSAGIAPLFAIKENNPIEAEMTMRVNALAFVECGKYMLTSECVNKNAAMVAVSSIVSMATTNRQSAYAASKAMLNTYVKYLAKEALEKMRVNAVLPGVVETEMYAALREKSENLDQRTKENQPLGIIPAEQVSKLVTFLLSEDAKFITGSLYTIDGGYLLT